MPTTAIATVVKNMNPSKPHVPPQRTQVPVLFKLNAPIARDVLLAADFTDWDASPRPLARDKNGFWQVEVLLPPGRYQYKYIVDGRWLNDPSSDHFVPNGHGSYNNIVEIQQP